MDEFFGRMIQTASLKITPEMLGLIAELDEFKGAWWALGTLAPERLSALRRIATIAGVRHHCHGVVASAEQRSGPG